ncbi:MAG: AraC family ligand binding domain-containing protein [Actinomycetota bacterium]|nr:AraC family ligand binding domain-containing protein [Actinomycetota bacterium]
MLETKTSALAEYTTRMAQVDIVDSIGGLPGVDTLEGRIGPIMSGNLGSAHYISMQPDLYCPAHVHSTESIIFTVRGQWVLCSEGQRHHMRQGSIFFMPPDIETGYEVPFDERAVLLIMKFEGSMDADEFLEYLEGLRSRLEERHDNGEPFLLSELPEEHDARRFAASLG